VSVHTYPLAGFLGRSGLDGSALAAAVKALPGLSLSAGPWLAGGAVRRAITGRKLDSDLDLFFASAEQLGEVKDALIEGGAAIGATTDHVVTLTLPREGEQPWKVQLCRIAYYAAPADVLDSFDFTICQCLTDGETLVVGEFTLWDLARKRLALHRLTYGTATVRRLIKYTRQGFTACSGALADILERSIADPSTVQREVEYVD
jgi:hypothetical protein